MTKLDYLMALGIPSSVAAALAKQTGHREPCNFAFNAAGGNGEILIYGPIGFDDFESGEGMTPTKFAAELRALGDIQSLTIRINSPGGYVWDGFAISSAIAQLEVPTHTIVEGIAASAASFIAIQSDRVTMTQTSRLMIHKALALVWANADTLRETAAYLDGLDNQLAELYAAKGNKTAAEFLADMAKETYFEPAEAVAVGLADDVHERKTKPPKNEGGGEFPKARIAAAVAAFGRRMRARA